MKISVELSQSQLKRVCRSTGEKKKGPAIRKMVEKALMMEERAEIVEKFVSGEWGVELEGFEEGQKKEREKNLKLVKAWRK
jgi:hypothetical protein